MIEIWKDIPNYEDKYQISSLGRLRNNKIIMKPMLATNGYLIACLWKNNRQKKIVVHRLVAKAFLANPNNYMEKRDFGKGTRFLTPYIVGTAIDKLAEYEDTNLTPQEIMELQKENGELKQKLENVEPKFKHKEWCWTIQNGKVWNVNVHLDTNTEHIYTFVYDGKKVIDEDGFEEFDAESGIEWGDKNLFKTKAEAQARLKELEGE